jgi:uncharacterized protein involved in response to NO
MLSYKGILSLQMSSVFFHSYSFIYLFFTLAFLAFLFTTFPRFLSQEPIKQSIYINIFITFLIGNSIFLIGSFVSSIIYKIGMLIIFCAFVYSIKILYDIHNKSDMPNKHDTYWILIGFVSGIVAHILFFFEQFNFIAIQLAIFSYLFIVGFSVAQRMIPFFSHCMYEKDHKFLRNIFILIVAHIILELINTNLSFLSDFVLAFIIAKEIKRWRLPFDLNNPMLAILHMALFWVPIAFLFAAISKTIAYFNSNYFLALDIHTLMLGFLFTVLIGFGTRVTIGHSGNSMYANKLTKFLFIFTQVVILSRLITSIVAGFGINFMILFDISATLWLIMFSMWAFQFFKVLIFGSKLD